jgi:hypothetical protein
VKKVYAGKVHDHEAYMQKIQIQDDHGILNFDYYSMELQFQYEMLKYQDMLKESINKYITNTLVDYEIPLDEVGEIVSDQLHEFSLVSANMNNSNNVRIALNLYFDSEMKLSSITQVGMDKYDGILTVMSNLE